MPFVIGADGAGSALRAAMNAMQTDSASASNRSVTATRNSRSRPAPTAAFAIEANALHIWPRGNYMCIALPNAEGSFTVTLFLPNEGDPSFATVDSAAGGARVVRARFRRRAAADSGARSGFRCAIRSALLATLYLDRWHIDGRALLIGDAAHAIVPFHGQGMNCGFEDAVELAELLGASPTTSSTVFAEFERRRRPNAEAIAAMALENYVEMRDSVADPDFLLRRELGRVLAERNPDHFMPRYSMVTFTRMPYAQAFARGAEQDRLLRELTQGKHDIGDIDLAAADAKVRSTAQAARGLT